MRILVPLFSPASGTWGGLTRVIAIAQAAGRAGHQVAFCASGYLEADLRKRDYQVFAVPPTTMFGLPPRLSRVVERRSQHVSLPVRPGKSVGNWWFVLALSGLARAGYLRQLADAELQAAREFRPDILFTDGDPGAFLVASITGLPVASAYASVMTEGIGSWSWKMMQRAITPVLKHYGVSDLTPDALYFRPSVLKIIPSIPELDGTDPNRPDVCYVGQLLGELDKPSDGFTYEQGHRYVFVYVGTGSISLDRLERVLPQLFPAGGKQTCLVGAQSVTETRRFGAVEFRPYVPAEALLPCCDWTLCHGGQNTIIQSLRHGVPLIVFPGPIFERRFNARQVKEQGAGLMGESNEFTAEWLRAAMDRQSECEPQAMRLARRIREYGGAPAAVEALAAWQAR